MEFTVGYALFLLVALLTLFLSLYEKFESPMIAVMFGLSTPGFVISLARMLSF